MNIECKSIVLLVMSMLILKLSIFPGKYQDSRILGNNSPNKVDVTLFIITICLFITSFYLNDNPLILKL